MVRRSAYHAGVSPAQRSGQGPAARSSKAGSSYRKLRVGRELGSPTAGSCYAGRATNKFGHRRVHRYAGIDCNSLTLGDDRAVNYYRDSGGFDVIQARTLGADHRLRRSDYHRRSCDSARLEEPGVNRPELGSHGADRPELGGRCPGRDDPGLSERQSRGVGAGRQGGGRR